VSMRNGTQPNKSSTCERGFRVTFLTELGDLPLMQSNSSLVYAEESVKGTKQNIECSGMGDCGNVLVIISRFSIIPSRLYWHMQTDPPDCVYATNSGIPAMVQGT
jgi:hypothetical protein